MYFPLVDPCAEMVNVSTTSILTAADANLIIQEPIVRQGQIIVRGSSVRTMERVKTESTTTLVAVAVDSVVETAKQDSTLVMAVHPSY